MLFEIDFGTYSVGWVNDAEPGFTGTLVDSSGNLKSETILIESGVALVCPLPEKADTTEAADVVDRVRWEYRILTELSEDAFNELGANGFELFHVNSETTVFIFRRSFN